MHSVDYTRILITNDPMFDNGKVFLALCSHQLEQKQQISNVCVLSTSEGRHLQVVHLTHCDEERELVVVDIELEEGSATDDL